MPAAKTWPLSSKLSAHLAEAFRPDLFRATAPPPFFFWMTAGYLSRASSSREDQTERVPQLTHFHALDRN